MIGAENEPPLYPAIITRPVAAKITEIDRSGEGQSVDAKVRRNEFRHGGRVPVFIGPFQKTLGKNLFF